MHVIQHLADQVVLWTLAPLGIFIVISGIDDFLVDLLWAWHSFRRRGERPPPTAELESLPPKRIAIYVPLWQEHAVVTEMLSHNVAAIRYPQYDFFIGVYPNDNLTREAVEACARRFANVHVAMCPHDGPTSKPDCLNWIYQHMLLHEEREGVHFDIVVTHDAEDLIHPESLHLYNHYAGEFGFVQIPVLALKTPLLDLTHGVYCDEFGEFQTRDLPTRNRMGSFVPSSGVGTAYSRAAVELLAATESNRVFDPGSLTEDYENGYKLHQFGVRQLFATVRGGRNPVATREYFPRRFKAAIRQRTRWVTGIALQGWERHGWEGGLTQRYWLWRDRKGLIASPLSLFTNIVCAYGILTGMWHRISPPLALLVLMGSTLTFQAIRMTVRIACAGRFYGWMYAVLAPVRALAGNVINAVAVVRALHRFALAKLRHERLVWVKTAHNYPNREALLGTRRRIGEVLVALGYIDQVALDQALATQPVGMRIGEHLVALGAISEDELYDGLAMQQLMPLADVDARDVPRRVARALPAGITQRWKVLPFRIASGHLDVASVDPPEPVVETILRSHTRLEVRFHLIGPTRYRELEEKLVH